MPDVKSALSLREKLAEASRGKDLKALQKAIEECEAARYPELSCDLQEARETLENLGGGRGGQYFVLVTLLNERINVFVDRLSSSYNPHNII